RFVGQSIRRVEDARVLTGRGRYVDDIRVPRLLHCVFVRSGVAHGRVVSVDVEAARALPGVAAVITGAELAAATEPMQLHMEIPNYLRPVFHPLATDRVRHVGDPLAIVVAESRYVAEDARDAVHVELEPLEAIATAEQ